MFEKLFVTPFTRARHRRGPFAAERERYLAHWEAHGAALNSQRHRAEYLLWIAEHLLCSDAHGIDATKLQAILSRDDTPPSASYASLAFRHGRAWFKFLGWWHQPPEPIPFETDHQNFVTWMRDERGLSKCTVTRWGDTSATFLRWCGKTGRELATLRPEDIDVYLATYSQSGWSRVSINFIVAMLRAFLRYTASLGVCSGSLADSIFGPRRYALEAIPSSLTWSDVHRVIAAANGDTEQDIRDRAILMLMAIYGLRRGEIAALRLDQIDWAAHALRIVRLKRNQPQIYPLVPSVAEALSRYIDTVRPDVAYPEIFIRLQSPRTPMTPQSYYGMVNHRLHAIGITGGKRGPHALRHACATRMLAQGLTLKEIGDHLGHRSAQSTMIYTKVDLVALREVGDFDLGDLS